MDATHQEGEGKSNQDLGWDRANSEDDSVKDTSVKNAVPKETAVVEELNKCPNRFAWLPLNAMEAQKENVEDR